MTAIKQDGPYDSRTLTKVFGVSSIALAVTTAWMVLDDHTRQWRGYQQTFRDIELARAKADADEALRASVSSIDSAKAAVAAAQALVDQKNDEIKAAQHEVEKAIAHKEAADLNYSVAKSYVDSYTFFFEHAGMLKETSEIAHYKKELGEANHHLAEAGAEKEKATQAVKDAQARVAGLQAPLLEANKKLEEAQGAVNRTERKVEQLAHNFRNDWFRNKPGVDFLDPTEKPKQIVLDNLKDDYYFAQVRKVDRCQSCHLAVDRRGFEGSIVHVEGRGLISVNSVTPNKEGGYDIALPNGHVDKIKTSELKHELKIDPVFRSHPNLDLYLSSSSPHPVDRFGCTVCHQGEGQSITFAGAVHAPNSESQREHWEEGAVNGQKLHWEEREHWIWPQFPTRYVQASCLLCHPNNRPIPGADKLNFGREVWERLSCVGCHKMKGYEDEPKRGPDLRRMTAKLSKEWVAYWLEDPARFRPKTNMPRFFNGPESALLAPTKEEKADAKVAGPEEKAKTLYDYDVREQVEIKAITRYLFEKSAAFAKEEEGRGKTFNLPKYEKGSAARGKTLFTARGCVGCHRVEPTKAEAEARRSYAPDEFGPNLYNTAHKTTPEWIQAWVSNPKHYWDETRMPNLRLDAGDARDIATYLTEGEGVKDEKLDAIKPAGWVDQPADALPGGKNQLDFAVKDYLKKDYTTPEIDAIMKGNPMKPEHPKLGTEEERFLFLGEQTVGRLGCFGCHYIKGMESRPGIGRELSDIGDKNLTQVDWGFESVNRFMSAKEKQERAGDKIRENRHEWLNLKVKHPRIFDRGKVKEPLDRSRMPQFSTTAFEREALVTYLIGHTGNRRVADEYKYKPSVRRANMIEGEYAMQRNNCKACHLLGVDRVSVTNESGVVTQPLHDAKGEVVRSPIAIDPVTKVGVPIQSKTWVQGHLVLDNTKLFGDEGAALVHLYEPALGKGVSEFQAISKASAIKSIDEYRPQLAGTEADLMKVLAQTQEDVWGPNDEDASADKKAAQKKAREEEKARQLEAIKKGLAWRNRGGTSLDKIIEARTSEAKGFNPWDASGKKDFDLEDLPVSQIEDAKSFGPPHLIGEGRKIQPLWLQSFLKDPVEIRPALRPMPEWQDRNNATFKAAGGAKMPTYGFSDAGTQIFSRYFAAMDEEMRLALAKPRLEALQANVKAKADGYRSRVDIQNKVYPTLDELQVREYFNIFIVDGVFNYTPRGDVSLSRALDEKTDSYFAAREEKNPGWYSAAYRLYTHPDINCQKCHIVRGQTPGGTIDAWAPDLWRVRERLRPGYLQDWIENPKAIIPGTKMAQLFFDGKQQDIMPAPAKAQVAAVVDWLMAGAPSVLEAFPKQPKSGSEVRFTSELLNLEDRRRQGRGAGRWRVEAARGGQGLRPRALGVARDGDPGPGLGQQGQVVSGPHQRRPLLVGGGCDGRRLTPGE
jgi:cytochrome c2